MCWQGKMYLGTLEMSLRDFDEELCLIACTRRLSDCLILCIHGYPNEFRKPLSLQAHWILGIRICRGFKLLGRGVYVTRSMYLHRRSVLDSRDFLKIW